MKKNICMLMLFLSFPSILNADNKLYHSIHQLADQSDLVIIGTVTVSTPRYLVVGASTIIVSDLTIPITETLQGSATSPVTVTVEGGTIAGTTMRASANPIIIAGMRGVWFLSTATGGKRTPIGKGAGIKLLNPDDTVYNERGLTLALIRLQVM